MRPPVILKSPAERISETLSHYHDGKFGFAIYRVDYDDGAKWTAFKDGLISYITAGLDADEHGHKIKDHLALDFMDDETKFSGASTIEIRRHFLQWLESIGAGEGPRTRYQQCIYVDAEVIDSVINGEDPSLRHIRIDNPAFVKVIFSGWPEVPFQLTEDEEPDEETRARYNAGDEGWPAIEGCKREDIGWMKCGAQSLIPEIYLRLMNSGWYLVYRRPPQILAY